MRGIKAGRLTTEDVGQWFTHSTGPEPIKYVGRKSGLYPCFADELGRFLWLTPDQRVHRVTP
jgi:hypothetical protein